MGCLCGKVRSATGVPQIPAARFFWSRRPAPTDLFAIDFVEMAKGNMIPKK
jgi:hypothetical protein